jgi:hypothetical protein
MNQAKRRKKMRQISIEELLIVTFVLIDDWYKSQAYQKPLIGRKVEMTDSEILTLIVAMDFLEFTSERHYLEFIRANYKYLFPNLLDQSQYNRRTRSLISVLESLRLKWANDLGLDFEKYFLLDTTPVIAVGYNRDKRHSDFLGSAGYGYCAARKLKYFGYKLVLLSTHNGIPGYLELIPANTDERAAADEVLDRLPIGSLVIGDKGFIGGSWKSRWSKINILTSKRENQKEQLPKTIGKLINGMRERIEGIYKLAKEGGRAIEHTLAHTVEGLVSRVLGKIAGLTLRQYLRSFLGIDVMTYQQTY